MDSVKFAQCLRKNVSGTVLLNERLGPYTSWKIGGPADIFFLPDNAQEVKTSVVEAAREGIPVTILGNGTNVLIRDGGISGLVIKLTRLRTVKRDGDLLRAEAGVGLPFLVSQASKECLSGLEFAVGIPASMGGAVVNNAGAHGINIQDVLVEVQTLDYEGHLLSHGTGDLHFGYRSSSLKLSNKKIVLAAVLQLRGEEPRRIKETMDYFIEYRRRTQPVGAATAGSVFINPPQGSAGYFIEQTGLKGTRVGGAQVSTKHANFIENTGGATASDVLSLIDLIREAVDKKFGIRLLTEIQVLGRGP